MLHFTRMRTAALLALVLLVGCKDPIPTGMLPPNFDVVAGGTSADVPADAAGVPTYVSEGEVGVAVHAPIIRVYQDELPWFGANIAHLTLVAAPPAGLGKVLGHDYFTHPLAALAGGIPAGTAVVLLTSNSNGSPAQAAAQNSPAAQAALGAFLASGGVVVIDMGDNLGAGGFIAPGSAGTPALIFPAPCGDATIVPAALGHPIILGPDGAPGGGDDLTDANVDLPSSCFVAHGNLVDGITLPAGATPIMTAIFGTPKPIMAEYCQGAGRVILDTNTKEFTGQQPPGTVPKIVARNLFSYALSPAAICIIPVDIDIKPGSDENPVNLGSTGLLPVAILTTAAFDAATVDASTVTLGDDAGTETPVALRKNGTPYANIEDVDGDLDLDLILHFSVPALVANGDLTAASTSLVLNGKNTSGVPIKGSDVVRIVP